VKGLFKKVIFVLIIANMLGIGAYAQIIGSYVNTDIVAYINDMPIKSYNINGWTGIVAEDLSDYGFDVVWSSEERTLQVGHYFIQTPEYSELNWQGNGDVTSTFVAEKNTKPVGSFAGSIYATDIKTYIAGDEVTAFNIGGRTIIYIDELSRFGNVVWYENERKICYNYVRPWNIDLYEVDYEANTSKNINSFSLNMTKNSNGEFETIGENLDYLTYPKLSYNKKEGMCFGFSLYQRVLFQTDELHNLLWSISTDRYDGEILAENADLANKHMKININGKPMTITRVTQGKGSGHTDFYFWFDCSLAKDEIISVRIDFN